MDSGQLDTLFGNSNILSFSTTTVTLTNRLLVFYYVIAEERNIRYQEVQWKCLSSIQLAIPLLLLTSPVIALKSLSHLVANNLWKGPPSIFNPHIETCTHTHTHWEQEQMWPSTAPLPKSNVPGLLWSRETTGAVVKYIVKGNRWLYLQCCDSQHIQWVPSRIDCKIRGRTSFSTCSLFTSAV